VAGRTICRAPGLDQGPFPEADALDAAGRLGTAECAAILALLDQDGLVIRTRAWRHDPACPGVMGWQDHIGGASAPAPHSVYRRWASRLAVSAAALKS
jgi:hypothetical protein